MARLYSLVLFYINSEKILIFNLFLSEFVNNRKLDEKIFILNNYSSYDL